MTRGQATNVIPRRGSVWLLPLALGLPLSLSTPAVAASRCGDAATPIHAIQGDSSESPLAGSVRTVEGVVVASFQGKQRLDGFFVQEEDADADDDPSTSEGLFVYAPRGRGVAVGERVRIRGLVYEYRRRTELTRVRSLVVCGGTELPTPARVSLPLADADALEPLEAMLVEVAGPLVVSDTRELGRYHRLLLSAGERLYQPTQLRQPGAAAAGLAAANARNRLVLDDGSRQIHPARIVYPPPLLSAEHTVRAGDRVDGLRGVIDQFGADYLLQPTVPPRFDVDNARPAPPRPPGAERLRVAAFNLHNYFNGDGKGGGFPTARGAQTRRDFERQRRKLVGALNGLAADVIGVVEIENDGFGPASAVADLTRGLSAGGPRYEYVHAADGRLGDDEIAVGLVYRPDRVRPVGPPAVLHPGVDRRFAAGNRPALAQTFERRRDGERLTVVVNHFKSKASSCADSGDPDRGDGQGNCNGTRTRAAEAVAAWLARDPTASGDPDVLVIGDLNAYAREDPVRTLAGAGYRDLIRQHLGEQAYTFVFDGRAGYLDHALASAPLAPQVAALHIWHINADEPPVLGYGAEGRPDGRRDRWYADGPYRSSDHDPVIVDLRLGGSADAAGRRCESRTTAASACR